MNQNRWIRQTHRWFALAFTVSAIIVTVVVLGREEPSAWVYLSPLLPLALLLFIGLYLFVLPYAAKWRSGSGTASDN